MQYIKYNDIKINEQEQFESILQYVKSKNKIEQHIQNMVQVLFNAYQISIKVLNKTNPIRIEFQFKDNTQEINEEFINNNPPSGFYLCLHQEIIPEIIQI